MKALSKETVLPYLKERVLAHLDFVEGGELQEFAVVGGGLVSHVCRVVVDGTPFYLKQAIPRTRKYREIAGLPRDLDAVFTEDRQLYEVEALNIFERAVGRGYSPHVYCHDVENNVIALSEALDSRGRLLEDTISREIDLQAAETLARIAAKLASKTYGCVKPLRGARGDARVKRVKLEYQCLDVYGKLEGQRRRLVKQAQESLVKESMKINKVLVQGDYHPRNILTEGSRVGIVDFEEAHVGDAAFDIGILLGSYLLRADYHEKVRKQGFRAVSRMASVFLREIDVPEDVDELEKRVKRVAGGLMLFRLDGIARKWTTWIKRESAKTVIREHATRLILDEDTPLPELVSSLQSTLN